MKKPTSATAMRSRRDRDRLHFAQLQLERLDERTVPANLVTAQLLGTNLVITGLDDLSDLAVLNGDNNQVVSITGIGPGSFSVDVGGGTEFLLPGKITSKATQVFKGVTSIKIDMRLGDDQVTINSAQLAGELSFSGGNGNDRLIIGGVAGNQTFGKISINNGDGNDEFRFGNGINKVAGDVKINNGVGDSSVLLNELATDELTIGGQLTISNGDGDDSLEIGGKSFFVGGSVTIANGNGPTLTKITPTHKATINGSLSLMNGEGFDFIALGSNNGVTVGQFGVGKGITIQNKGGGSSVSLDGAVSISGKVSVNSGHGFDSLSILSQPTSSLILNGALNLATGNGSSELFLGGSTAVVTGGVTIVNGAGFDNIQLTPGSFNVGGLVSINNGTGGSYVGLSPSGSLVLSGGTTVTNAAGEDTLVIGGTKTVSVSVKNLTVNHGHGGSGTYLSATSAVTIGGAATVNALDGSDKFSIATPTLNVSGAVLFKAGQGDAEAYFSATTLQSIGGPVTVDAGAGNLLLAFGTAGAKSTSKGLMWSHGNGDTQIFLDGSVQINGSLTGKAAEGFDKINVLGGLIVNGSVSITNAAGGSETLFAGPTKVTGSFTLNNGDGTDLIEITGSSFDVFGTTTILQGVGDNSPPAVAVGGPSTVKIVAAQANFSGGLTIKALSGDDIVQFSGAINAKTLALDLGADVANVKVNGTLGVLGNLSIQLGDADDSLVIPGNVSVVGTTTVRTGAGDDQVHWYGGSNVLQGAVTIDTGDGADEVAVQGWTVKSATKVSTGWGNDRLFVDNCVFAAVTIDTGAGSDEVYIETQDLGASSLFKGPVSVNLGDGDDLVIVGMEFDPDDFALFNGAVNVNGGNGLDQLYGEVDRVNVFVGPVSATNVEVLF